jgi:hypothetical protein
LFRSALREFDATWAVSEQLSGEMVKAGRQPDWIASVGVERRELPGLPQVGPEQRRLFSPRGAAPLYRATWIRDAVSGEAWTLVEADRFDRSRMFTEYQRAELVISIPETDGAPATVMEALCSGAHVLASGGPTVRGWLERFGGTYGEPSTIDDLRNLLRRSALISRRESVMDRQERATAAREHFDRDRTLAALLAFVEGASRPLRG